MDFDEYQKITRKMAVYPNVGANLSYPVIGLFGEGGEVAEKIKKLIRDGNGEITEEFRASIKKELGDVLWYLAALTSELGLSFNGVAEHNVEKLTDRRDRNTVKGSGDNR